MPLPVRTLHFFRTRPQVAWGLLMALSLFARLIGLGHRAMSHDESLHTVYSWYLAEGRGYQHDPMMHGPLLFHTNALIYRLFGATDFTSRILPALAGTACVAMLALFRRWMGQWGAFAAAVLVALCPDLLYYSRYIRNDIYICLFTLVMVWGILRYGEERQPRHLLWMSLGLALSFACKEVCYIHGFVLGIGCILLGLLRIDWTRVEWKRLDPVALWRLLDHPFFDAAAAMLLLALPFASALLHIPLGWDPLDNRTPAGQTRIYTIAGALFALAFLAGCGWFHPRGRLRLWLGCVGIFWGVNLLLYTTFFTNTAHGLASGVAGALGYWLQQHEVKRGSDDTLFYLALLLLYTPLLLAGAAGAVFASLRRKRRLFGPARGLGVLLAIWTLGNFLIYSWAGERMPWLLNHITLPLCLAAGPFLAGVFERGAWPLRAAFAALFVQFLANSIRVNGPLAESYFEPLMYAHAGPDLKPALALAREHLERNPGTWVQVHTDFSWPLVWYLRGLTVSYDPSLDPPAANASVLVAPVHERDRLRALGWTPRVEVDMITWPRQHWIKLNLSNFRNLLRYPAVRRKFIRFYLTRQQPPLAPGEWPAPSRFLLLTRVP